MGEITRFSPPLRAVGLFLWPGTRRHWCRSRRYYICPAPLHQASHYSPKLGCLKLSFQLHLGVQNYKTHKYYIPFNNRNDSFYVRLFAAFILHGQELSFQSRMLPSYPQTLSLLFTSAREGVSKYFMHSASCSQRTLRGLLTRLLVYWDSTVSFVAVPSPSSAKINILVYSFFSPKTTDKKDEQPPIKRHPYYTSTCLRITGHIIARNFSPGILVPIFLSLGILVPCNFGPQNFGPQVLFSFFQFFLFHPADPRGIT